MFVHVYEAAIVAILAIAIGLALLPRSGPQRWWFLAGIASASVSLALTHSRAAFLGLVLVVAIAGVASLRSMPSMRAGLLIVLIGFGVPALMTASTWQARLTESVSGSLDEVSSGRVTLMKQAVDLAISHPIVGVGPNRYIEVLESRVDESEVTFVVHNIPLMVAAELGIPAGIIAATLLVWTGFQAVIGGYRTGLLFAAPMPFFLFDVIMYNRPFGLLLFAMWCGLLGAMLRESTLTAPAAAGVHIPGGAR
jgi:O-antigen ligase